MRDEGMSRRDVEPLANDRHPRHAPVARCVAGALISDGKVRLVKRSPQSRFYPDVWDLFGGHIKEGESSENALRTRGSGVELPGRRSSHSACWARSMTQLNRLRLLSLLC